MNVYANKNTKPNIKVVESWANWFKKGILFSRGCEYL